MRPVGLPTADGKPQSGKFLVQTCAQLCDNRAKDAVAASRGLASPGELRRKGPFDAFSCKIEHRRPAQAAGVTASARGATHGRGGRMSNFFVAIAVFLITVIGALFAIPYFIDWNGYRGVFEEEATRLLGREVRVGGAVNLHLLPTPYFRFEKVRIADTSANLQDAFFRADSLTIKLSVPPIFRGAIEANEIELQRPVLRLALDKDDGWNWQSFGQAARTSRLPADRTLR